MPTLNKRRFGKFRWNEKLWNYADLMRQTWLTFRSPFTLDFESPLQQQQQQTAKVSEEGFDPL